MGGSNTISANLFNSGGTKKRTSNIEPPTSNFKWEEMNQPTSGLHESLLE